MLTKRAQNNQTLHVLTYLVSGETSFLFLWLPQMKLVSVRYCGQCLGMLGTTSKQIMNSQGRMCANIGRV